MRMRKSFGLCIVPALMMAAGPAEPAAGQDRRLAITDIAQVDEDFVFQGEYVGTVHDGTGTTAGQPAGLQVVALGGGRFQAVLLPGGLAGAGWTGAARLPLEGVRQNGALALAGERLSVVVADGSAHVRDGMGRDLGRLSRTHRISPTQRRPVPPEGIVLFDGAGTDRLRQARLTEDGLLREGAEFRDAWRDFSLHLEFRLPYMPHARGQGRANSGVYLQRRYEVQILDSFGLEGTDNECGALYRYKAPDVNMCFPPLAWQTYDVQFRAARFDDDGQRIETARVSVWHNGVLVHNEVELDGPTGAGRPEGPEPLPTLLQDHGNPVHFRNLWLVDHEQYPHYPARELAELTLLAAPASPGAPAAAPGAGLWGFVPPGSVAPFAGAAVAPAAAAPVAADWPVYYHYPPVYYQPAWFPAGHPSTWPYPPVQAPWPMVYHQPAVYPPGHPSTVPYPPAVAGYPAIYSQPAYYPSMSVSPVPLSTPPGVLVRP